MSQQNTEKRLAELEKGLKASAARAKAAEERAAAAELALKELKARARDQVVQLAGENRQLRTMRDLAGPTSGYDDDPRRKIAEMMRATVKTKDGQRHYFTDGDAYVNGVYIKGKDGGAVVSIPAEQEPSVTWHPVKVGGKDAKTGKLIFVPIEAELDADKEVDPSQQVDGDTPTNTELNERAAAGRQRAARRGAGAPVPPSPLEQPGANETEGESTEQRPADTDVG